MSSKKKTLPVICSNCNNELHDYKDIAAEIRLQAAKQVATAANDTVISIVTASPFRTGQHGVEVAMSAKDLIQVAFASSRRKVLNIAKFSLSKS
jgi:hypothetical protein